MMAALDTDVEPQSSNFIEQLKQGSTPSTPVNLTTNIQRASSELSGKIETRPNCPIDVPPMESRSSLASGFEQELAALNTESEGANDTPRATVHKDDELTDRLSKGNLIPAACEESSKNVTKPSSSQSQVLNGNTKPSSATPLPKSAQSLTHNETRVSSSLSLENQNARQNSSMQERALSVKEESLHSSPVPRAPSTHRNSTQSVTNGNLDTISSPSRASNSLQQTNQSRNGDVIPEPVSPPSADHKGPDPQFSRNSQRFTELDRERLSKLSESRSNPPSQLGHDRKESEDRPVDRGGSPSPSLSRQSTRVSFHEGNISQHNDAGVRPPSGSSVRHSAVGTGGASFSEGRHSSPSNERLGNASPSASSHAGRRSYDLQKALQVDELEVKIEQLKKLLLDRDRHNRQQAEQISSLERELAGEKERSKTTPVTPTNYPREKSVSSTDQVMELERRVDQLLMERENLITELNETKKELAAVHNQLKELQASTESPQSTKAMPPEESRTQSATLENGVGLRNFDPNHPSALKRRIADLESQLQDLQEAHHSLLLHESRSAAPPLDHASAVDSRNNLLLQELQRENCLLKEEMEHAKKTFPSSHSTMTTVSPTHPQPLVESSVRKELDDLKRDMHTMRDRGEQLAAENQRLRDQMKLYDRATKKGAPPYDSAVSSYRVERSRVIEDVNRLKRELHNHSTNNRYSSSAPYCTNYNGSSKSKSLANLVSEEDCELDQHSPSNLTRGSIYRAPNPKDYNSPYEEARSMFQSTGATTSTRPFSGGGQHASPGPPPPATLDHRMTTSAYPSLHKYNNKYAISSAASYLSERTSVLAVDPTHRRYVGAAAWNKSDDEDEGDLTSALLDENVDELLVNSVNLSPASTSKRHGNKHRHRRHHQHHHSSNNPQKSSRPRNGSISGDTASILSDADRELKEYPYATAAVLSGAETITSRPGGFVRNEMRHHGVGTNVNAPAATLEPSHLRSYTGGPVRVSPQTRPHFTDHHGGLFPSSRDPSGNFTHTNSSSLTAENSRLTTIGKHPFAPRTAADISMGDVVKFSRNAGRISNGLVHYIGPLPGRNDMYLGVELDMEEGKHDGVYEGRRYFQCKRNKGVFVAFNKVIMCYGHSEK